MYDVKSFKSLLSEAWGSFPLQDQLSSLSSKFSAGFSFGQNKLVNLINMHKLTKLESSAAYASQTIIDQVDLIGDDDALNLSIVDNIMNAAKGTSTATYLLQPERLDYALASFDGMPAEMIITGEVIESGVREYLYFDGCFSAYFQTVYDAENTLVGLHLTGGNVDGVKSLELVADGVGGKAYCTVDDYLDVMQERSTVNAAMTDLIEGAQRTGEITASRAYDILDNYGSSASIQQLKSLFNGIDSYGSTGIFALLGQFIKARSGSYNSGSYTYDPAETPGYSTSVIATVALFAYEVLTVVLAAVFNAVAAIIVAVSSMILSLVQVVSERWSVTKGTVNSASDLPAWNVPFGFHEMVGSPSDDPDFIDDASTFGSLGYDHPDLPVVLWLVPFLTESGSVSKFFIQTFLRPDTNRVGIYSGNWPAYTYSGDGTNHSIISVSKADVDRYAFPANWDWMSDDIDYLSDSDALLSRKAGANFFNYLYYCALRCVNRDSSYSSGASFDIGDQATPPYLSTEDIVVNYNAFKSQNANADWIRNSSMRLAWFIIVCLSRWRYQTEVLHVDTDAFDVLPTSEYSDRLSYDTVSYWLLSSGNYISADKKQYYRELLSDFSALMERTAVSIITNDDLLNHYTAGAPLTKPNCDWPEYSRSAIITALIVTALTAAATVTAAIVVRVKRRSAAVARLAAREKQFNDAKAVFEDNPSDPKARKAFVKANKKLTKAWKKAGKAGVAMYNGFDCGATGGLTFPTRETADTSANTDDTLEGGNDSLILRSITG